MKKNKIIILTLALVALLAQGTCAYAASSTEDEYTKEEMNNRTPGFAWEDIDKSNQNTSSYINSFSSAITPEQLAKDSTKTTTTTTTATSTTSNIDSTPENTIVSTAPSTGVSGDYWGKTSGGKWILLEQGVPVRGWKAVRGKWYYMDPNGVMQTGWVVDGQDWYYLNPTGEMAHDTYIGNYYVNSNGVMQ